MYKQKEDSSHTIHDLPKSERPRERLFNQGADKLSETELLAIILRTGSKGENVLVTAQKLISKFGSLHELTKASVEDLKQIKGIGTAKAIELAAIFEIARRVNAKSITELKKKLESKSITEPEEAADLMRSYITDFNKEHFIIASFDTRNRLLGVDNISTGILTSAIVHPREVFLSAIKRHAANIIAAHNHPSGDPNPSDEDIRITKRLQDAGGIMGIEINDHIILTKNSYFSFKEKGMM